MKLPVSGNKISMKPDFSAIWKSNVNHMGKGIPEISNISVTYFIVCLIAVVFISAGCGKKGPPVPPPEEIPSPVIDLTSEINGQIITLSWSIPRGETADQLTGFKLFRSTNQFLESDCKDCPVVFKLIADIPVEIDNNQESENRKIIFFETLELPDNRENVQANILKTDDVQTDDTESLKSDEQKDNYTVTPKRMTTYDYKVVGYTEYGVRSPDSNVVRVELHAIVEKAPLGNE